MTAPPRKSRQAPRDSYHHGDLRQALIDGAIEILRDEGPEALTLRGVARAAGVSPAAPYRHFPDRRALVAAVAEDGFARLRAAMQAEPKGKSRRRSARSGSREPGPLEQLAFAYVRFAHTHPAEYRVMFGEEIAREKAYPQLVRSSAAVFEMLSGGIATLQKAGVIREGDPDQIAIGAWAMMHGLVMLSLDGHATLKGRSLHQLVDEATKLLMFGMIAPAARAAIAGKPGSAK